MSPEAKVLLSALGLLLGGGCFGFIFGVLYQQDREVTRMFARWRDEDAG